MAISEQNILWFVRQQGQWETNVTAPLDAVLATDLEGRYSNRSDAPVSLISNAGRLRAGARHPDLSALFERIDAIPVSPVPRATGQGTE